jgi:hypothetical protein
MSNLHDEISIQLDKRKLQKLVDEGVITWDEITSAEIIDETDEL